MKFFLITLPLLLGAVLHVNSSPFELTEDYVKSFKEEIEKLKTISKNYKHQEGSLNLDLEHDHEEAIKNAVEFDFIVIGAGTSGAIVANRLSEVPEWKILVLEAGDPETETTQIPLLQTYLETTHYNWGYHTIPQNHSCLGFEANECSIPQGKALGGTTAINNMLFVRGNEKDYDIWADLDLKEWCWRDLLPYFKKLEDAHIPNLDRKLHNLGGPVHLEHFQHFSKLQEHFLEALNHIGVKTVDVNGKEQLGVGIPHAITKNGKRNSVTQSYLVPASKRNNLKIYPKSPVLQILISPHTKQAYGVKFIHEGKIVYAKSNKEILLAAGGIGSPKLLLLSGIGPKEDLEHLGIVPKIDLKVGHEIKDHLKFVGLTFVFNKTEEGNDEKYDEVIDYLKNGKGPLTNPNIDLVAFLKTEISKNKHLEQPDIEILIKSDLPHVPGIRKDIQEKIWQPLEHSKVATVEITLLHPKSTGSLTLHDKNPLHQPLINTLSLTDVDDHDIEVILEGIKSVIKLTEPLEKLGVHINPHKIPECEKHEKENYWKCAIRHLSVNAGDVTGGAKMGLVVDNKLKVLNVKGLRVVDGSVIPVTISGNIMAATMVIGEKGSDIIKEEWK